MGTKRKCMGEKVVTMRGSADNGQWSTEWGEEKGYENWKATKGESGRSVTIRIEFMGTEANVIEKRLETRQEVKHGVKHLKI